MARTNPDITQQEDSAYTKWAQRNNIICGDGSEAASKNAEFIIDYFLNQWQQDITEKNLDSAFSVLQPYLHFYEPHQKEFVDLYAALSNDEKSAFNTGLEKFHLKKGSYRSAVAILSWLKIHGFPVNEHNLGLAIGQSRVVPFLEWDPAVTPEYKNPYQHQETPGTDSPFRGASNPITREEREQMNKPHWMRVADERKRQDAERAKFEGRAPVEVEDFRKKAEEVRGMFHSQTEGAQRIFVFKPGTTEIDWFATYQARMKFCGNNRGLEIRIVK